MKNTKKSPLIVIIGPTASGKSDLGIKLAKKFNGEIISADSRQVYRGMNLGTGKVPKDKFQYRHDRIYIAKGIGHHLLDVANPKKVFTVSDFKRLGKKALKEIVSKGKVPIIVGGTGFYIDVLLGRMVIAEVPPNKELRSQFDKLTVKKLFEKLQKLDPDRAETIDRFNKRRLVRALEVVLTTKKSSVTNPRSIIRNAQYDILWLGIKPKDIGKRIKIRLDRRLKQGMIGEVKKLLKQGVSHKRLQRFGLEYKCLSLYLQNKISYKEMRENLLKDIIRYSKRQMTWFKRNKEIRWVKSQKEAEKLIRKFIAPLP